jgi:ATP-dependent RNA helicase DDX35
MSGGRFWRPGSSAAPPATQQAPSISHTELPVLAARAPVLFSLEQRRTLVLTAPTGAGKTTQLPQILATAGWAKPGSTCVALALPQRTAVLAAAARITAERSSASVGHVLRGYAVQPADAEIVIYEAAALIDAARDDPLLSAFSVVVVDDAHQHALYVDVLLAMLRVVQRRRGDLRIVVAAEASLDVGLFVDFFGGDRHAAALHVAGPSTPFPVHIFYARDPVRDYLEAAFDSVKAVHADLSSTDAASCSVLVFVPTSDDTTSLSTVLADWAAESSALRPLVQVIAMNSSLPHAQENAAAERSVASTPAMKVVVVASSVTHDQLVVDGVATVIDCGYDCLEVYSPEAQSLSLAVAHVSQVAANQRAACAGRTRQGSCLRLYTQHDFETKLPRETPPEILRGDLSDALLSLKAAGVQDIASFSFLVPPSLDALAGALARLHALGAVDADGRLTGGIGYRLAAIPLPPHLGRALLAGEARGVGRQVAAVCAMLQVAKPLFATSSSSPRDVFAVAEGDAISLFNVFRRYCSSQRSSSWCARHGINALAMARALKIRQQLVRQLRSRNVDPDALAEDAGLGMAARISRALVSGLFANAAMMQADGLTYRLVLSGATAVIHPASVLNGRAPRWVIAAEVVRTSQLFLRNVTVVQPAWLSSDVPFVFQHVSAPVVNRRNNKRLRHE